MLTSLLPSRRSGRALATGIAVLLFSELCPTLSAANIWDGEGPNGLWSTPLNWDNNAVPALPQSLVFTGAQNLQTTNDLTGAIVSGITFDVNAGAFVIGGN